MLTIDVAVDPAATMQIATRDGDVVECEVVGVADGIAVLRPAMSGPPALTLDDRDATAYMEQELVYLGFGRSGWSTSRGHVIGLEQVPLGPDAETYTLLRCAMRTEPGHAGAPVVARSGKVVAMAFAHDPGPGHALLLPISEISAGLASLGLLTPRQDDPSA